VLDWTPEEIDTAWRLCAAAVVGMLIGLNRDVSGKPMGMRTLGLVALGTALAALATVHYGNLETHPDALSRVVQGVLQGVLAGVGFLGAGVILHDAHAKEVHGLTTAATVWVVAALGIACALAAWHLVFLGVAATLFILIVMKPVEHFLVRLFDRFHREDQDGPRPR
jgi:putative Mg2+ transporter-C (MgtC) family protein